MARVRLILELRSDLHINDDALPAVLSLIDQVYGLRRELRSLARAVENEEADVRRRIVQFMAQLRTTHPSDTRG